MICAILRNHLPEAGWRDLVGALSLDWEVAGFGPMHGPGTSDMVLRNVPLDPQVCG